MQTCVLMVVVITTMMTSGLNAAEDACTSAVNQCSNAGVTMPKKVALSYAEPAEKWMEYDCLEKDIITDAAYMECVFNALNTTVCRESSVTELKEQSEKVQGTGPYKQMDIKEGIDYYCENSAVIGPLVESGCMDKADQNALKDCQETQKNKAETRTHEFCGKISAEMACLNKITRPECSKEALTVYKKAVGNLLPKGCLVAACDHVTTNLFFISLCLLVYKLLTA